MLRAAKILANGSVFYFLTLPLFAFASCKGPVLSYTGYQTLRSVPLPAAQFGMTPGFYPDYPPDYWVVGIMLFAIIGLASAWRGGVSWSLAGGAAAVLGLQGLQAAILFFNPPHPPHVSYWTPEPLSGGIAIGFAFSLALLADLGSLSARGFYELQHQTPPSARTRWALLAWLGAIGVAVLGLILLIALAVVLVIAAFHH